MNTRTLLMSLLLSISSTTATWTYASNEHGGSGHEEQDNHDDEGATILSPQQIKMAGIVVKAIKPEIIHSVVTAPGEVHFNNYKTAAISPRITSQVIGCHVELGEDVRIGQPIVTLSSVDMAAAQGDLLVADREWKRVKKLGRKVVSESRYTQAKVDWELARGKVKAYGMSDDQIKNLLDSEDFSRANGQFDLVATHGGVVLAENYILGKQVEPGHELIRITNERSLWVVANVSPATSNTINIGNKAIIDTGNDTIEATVIQKYHSLDEKTRTTGIRLSVENTNELIHPGMFVTAQIETSLKSKELTLPEAAVLRSDDGDWMIMVQDNEGKFSSKEIELKRITNGRAVLRDIEVGTRVVTEGAFFVWSESAKAGFGDDDH